MNGNPFYEPYWDTALEHHGIKGMKWGVRRTPEQLGYKKKKSGGLISNFKKKAAKRKAQAAKAKQKKKEQLTEKQKEELREKLLKSTDAKFLMKHADLLETKEIKERLDRIDTEKKLKNLTKDDKSKKNVEKGMEWVDNIKKIAEATEKAATAYTKVVDAKEKVASNERARKRETEQDRERREAAKNFNKVIKGYSEAAKDSDYSDIEIEFDPKTGKLGFKNKKSR